MKMILLAVALMSIGAVALAQGKSEGKGNSDHSNAGGNGGGNHGDNGNHGDGNNGNGGGNNGNPGGGNDKPSVELRLNNSDNSTPWRGFCFTDGERLWVYETNTKSSAQDHPATAVELSQEQCVEVLQDLNWLDSQGVRK